MNKKPSLHPSNAWFLMLLLVTLAWIGRLGLYYLCEEDLASPINSFLLSFLYRFVIFVLPVFLFLRWVDKEPVFEFLKLTTSMTRGLAVGFVILAIGAVCQTMAIYLNVDSLPDEGILGLLEEVVVPGVFEEIFFRGFVLNQLRRTLSFHRANFYTSLLFLPFHWVTWLMVAWEGMLIMLVRSFFLFFLISLPLGLFQEKTNSLWPCIAFHMMVNFIN